MVTNVYRYFILVFLGICTACQPPATQSLLLSTSTPPKTLAGGPTDSQTPSPSSVSTQSPIPTQTLALTSIPTLTQTPAPAAIHAMRVDYPDFTSSRGQVDHWEQLMQAAGINMVGLGAGRLEWTYFKWAGHEANWASPVTDTGIDYLAEDTTRFGKWALVNAVVDVLSPNYIKAHPDKAAIRVDGVPSTDLVSTTELTIGEYGRQLLALIEYIAANYPVNSISLTELFYHTDGYGADDKASYLAYSGNLDWPRNSDGTIASMDKSIGDWRTYILDVYLDQVVIACHKYGKQFYLDVGLTLDYGFNTESLNHITNEHGTNYKVVLEHTDRIIIWGYFSLDKFTPENLQDVSQFLGQFGQDRIILSIGLWGLNGSVITADELKRGIIAARTGGMPNIWITPGSLMSAGHWQVLDQLWDPTR
jgi:hypothetical protein